MQGYLGHCSWGIAAVCKGEQQLRGLLSAILLYLTKKNIIVA